MCKTQWTNNYKLCTLLIINSTQCFLIFPVTRSCLISAVGRCLTNTVACESNSFPSKFVAIMSDKWSAVTLFLNHTELDFDLSTADRSSTCCLVALGVISEFEILLGYIGALSKTVPVQQPAHGIPEEGRLVFGSQHGQAWSHHHSGKPGACRSCSLLEASFPSSVGCTVRASVGVSGMDGWGGEAGTGSQLLKP